MDNAIPIHDPYIPRSDVKFYNCSNIECQPLILYSITQITSPALNLKSCFLQGPEQFECENIRYNYFKNIDKLLFLSKNIPGKTFYLVDCLVYTDGERVCHTKDASDSPTKLIDTGEIVRPKETAVLSQEEYVCEQSADEEVICDLNPYVPFKSGLNFKEAPKIVPNILLKTGTYLVPLKLTCEEHWCGYRGLIPKSRRSGYQPPGGDVYRCYYAKKQQICKKIYNIYNTPEEIFDAQNVRK